jgi:hypothetical protein
MQSLEVLLVIILKYCLNKPKSPDCLSTYQSTDLCNCQIILKFMVTYRIPIKQACYYQILYVNYSDKNLYKTFQEQWQ